MKKSLELELMDTASLPFAQMIRVLDFLTITNKFFGGNDVVLQHLESWSVRWDKKQPIRILDVGTGAADLPLVIHQWAKRKGFLVYVTAIDIVPDVIVVAQDRTRGIKQIAIRQQNLFELSASAQYDYVIASLFLHHVSPDQYVNVLRTFDQLAIRGILISDLQRNIFSYGAVCLLSMIIGNSIVRHDGPLSVQRAFTTDELSTLAKQSALFYLKARSEKWFRVSLAGEKY